jgi:hypothetical protein
LALDRRAKSTLSYRVFEDAGLKPTKTALVMHGILGTGGLVGLNDV